MPYIRSICQGFTLYGLRGPRSYSLALLESILRLMLVIRDLNAMMTAKADGKNLGLKLPLLEGYLLSKVLA